MADFDVFLSYASEDVAIVERLVESLRNRGLAVWFDKEQLVIGDSLRTRIDEGLSRSRCGIAVLSENYLRKYWPGNELSALEAKREIGQGAVLPVWHGVDKTTVAKYSPTLADRLAGDLRHGVDRVAHDIADAIRQRLPRMRKVAVDMSHKQAEWNGFETSLRSSQDRQYIALRSLKDAELAKAPVLIITLPFHCEFSRAEIRRVQSWVQSGGSLLLLAYYLADKHHGSNPSHLAQAFGFAFSSDLLMPVGRTDRRNCLDQAFETDAFNSVSAGTQTAHPICQGVAQLALLSACSLCSIVSTPDVTISTDVCSVMEPEARMRGWKILQLIDYTERGKTSVPVVAAWQHGRGKVVACGTWKLMTLPAADNSVLVRNTIEWLSGS